MSLLESFSARDFLGQGQRWVPQNGDQRRVEGDWEKRKWQDPIAEEGLWACGIPQRDHFKTFITDTKKQEI